MEPLEIVVKKLTETKLRTISEMRIGGNPFCFILEDGFNETKIAGITRIAGGRYEVVPRTYGKFFEKYKKQFKHKFGFEIKDVPNFSDILIHIGNYISDTRGCLLVGKGLDITQMPGGVMVLVNSTAAYKAFYDLVAPALEQGRKVFITIER